MGTRSTISIENKDKTITSVYCHWDGYIEHHGPILLNHYNTEAKVRELLSYGSMSSLGEKIGDKHDFNAHVKGICTFYDRDRGETDGTAARTGKLDELDSQEYNYLFRNGKWLVSADERGWRDLVIETVIVKLA